MAQLMPLPLTVSCSSKIQIGFTFLVPAYPGCPGKEAVKWLYRGYIISYSYGNRLEAFSDNSLKISTGLNNLKYILIRHKPVTYSLMVITIRKRLAQEW